MNDHSTERLSSLDQPSTEESPTIISNTTAPAHSHFPETEAITTEEAHHHVSSFPSPREMLEALQQTMSRDGNVSWLGGNDGSDGRKRRPGEASPVLTQRDVNSIRNEGLDGIELLMRVIEAEPMGIERLASLLNIKSTALRPTIRMLEAQGMLETHRDRIMLGPAHVVALPCSTTAIEMVRAAFTRRQVSRHDIKKNTGLSDDTIRQAMAYMIQNGDVKQQFIGAMPIYELLSFDSTVIPNNPVRGTKAKP